MQETFEYYILEAQDLYTKSTDTLPTNTTSPHFQLLRQAQEFSVHLQTFPPKQEPYWNSPKCSLLNQIWDSCYVAQTDTVSWVSQQAPVWMPM